MNNSDAREIVRALADGVDPTTGELFETNSPFQHPNVIRALFAAADALEGAAKRESRQRSLPANAGKPWSDEEDKVLAESYKQGMSVGDLSSRHGRTYGSIESRLIRNGLIEAKNPPYGNDRH
ncbi:MAG TPA: hypothetical protein PKC89_07230 [Pyrinomonadaceae bacterium]|nr:hypothetical protein [Pyrinomonadaceae bacterium]